MDCDNDCVESFGFEDYFYTWIVAVCAEFAFVGVAAVVAVAAAAE